MNSSLNENNDQLKNVIYNKIEESVFSILQFQYYPFLAVYGFSIFIIYFICEYNYLCWLCLYTTVLNF